MDVVETLSSDGVPTDTEGGTPSPLPEERTADGLEAIELAPVLEVVAGHAAGPLGAARVRGRRPVLDLEVSNGLGSAALIAWAQTWLEQVTQATGVRPIIYTNAGFWSGSMANTDWFARNGYAVLWIAHWTTAAQPNVPAGDWGGNGWTFWQDSSTGSVPGVTGAVDLDRFNGSTIPGSLLVP